MASDRGRQGLPLHLRIRLRREGREMTGQELAEQVGVSSPYISLIETGKKIPSEDVAVRIAKALDDDADLYRAWASAGRHDDLKGALLDMMQAYQYSSDPRFRKQLSSGEDIQFRSVEAASDADSSPKTWLSRLASALGKPVVGPRMIEVPVLREGVDPGDDDEIAESAVTGTLHLDPQLFGNEKTSRPFAYKLASERGAELRAGDWVVVTSRPGRIVPGKMYAVRRGTEVILTRAVVKGDVLLLLDAPGSEGVEMIRLDDKNELARRIAGRVVTIVRGSGA